MIPVTVFLDLEEMPDNRDNLFVYLSKGSSFQKEPVKECILNMCMFSSHHISMCKTMCTFRLDNYLSGLLLHGLLFNVGTKKTICIHK